MVKLLITFLGFEMQSNVGGFNLKIPNTMSLYLSQLFRVRFDYQV